MELKKISRFERIIVDNGQNLARAIQVADGPHWIILNIAKEFITDVPSEKEILEAYERHLNSGHQASPAIL